jgi:hypothetical protein
VVATKKARFTLEIEAPANGRVGKATVLALDQDGKKVVASDSANLNSATERRKLVKRMAEKLGISEEKLGKELDAAWNETLTQRKKAQERAAAGSPEAATLATIEMLDALPQTIARPLCLVGGTSYAGAWVSVQTTTGQTVDPKTGVTTTHDPPLVTVEDVLSIMTGDGQLYADKGVLNARPLAELGLTVRLPFVPPPGRGMSGAGVKRYQAGERPDPRETFGRVKAAVDRFIDFSRSLASQETMCELTACYVLSSYLLDAFHVVGYLWPNGERGTGKTSFLQLVAELAYLEQVILAGSSYACLRDMADYGATLAFDDAENVMDVKRSDPDKRTLLLAGNRRGATVAVKEPEPDGKRWTTRYVNTFCPRLFSAILLPDETLGSRAIIVPLVRSGDEHRAKANPLDPQDWPCDRRRLVDDLWALGLAHLPSLAAHDRRAAASAKLMGRSLDAWRPVLAVAHWLQERHGAPGLFDRLEKLSVQYDRQERDDLEDDDRTRVLFRVLLSLAAESDGKVKISPGAVAEAMNAIAVEEHLGEPEEKFTNPKRVGQLLKRQRFKRPTVRSNKSRQWEATREEIVLAASAFGVGEREPGEDEELDEAADAEAPF